MGFGTNQEGGRWDGGNRRRENLLTSHLRLHVLGRLLSDHLDVELLEDHPAGQRTTVYGDWRGKEKKVQNAIFKYFIIFC
jgi:hypothetical protein